MDTARKRWPAQGGITGWSKTGLPTLNIFRAALSSNQWLAATGWHLLLHSQWLWSQYCWTSYTLPLNNYFWYLRFGAERYDGAKRTKQRTSGTLEEHFILRRPSTLSIFYTLLALLQRVKQLIMVAGASEDLMDIYNGMWCANARARNNPHSTTV